ncbi:MAG: rRNA pseudouridine synthase [Candidatus Sumerlaeia bacterium]|nr:rRNA pseudouridine synthase [Candidatus Sumerlaeia bacterium]
MEPTDQEPAPTSTVRIAKFLSACGVASRRKAEELIRQGRISVNGSVISDLGRQVAADDAVMVDGQLVTEPNTTITLAHNKPLEVLVTSSDDRGRRTVYDLLPEKLKRHASRLRYAGRLDFLSTGLLVLTTDGELVNKLVHPRHHIAKTYEISTNMFLSQGQLEALRQGVDLEDGRTLPCEVRDLGHRKSEGHRYEIVLREGRNRQIRRMVEAVGARVARLHRVSMGGLSLRDLSLARGEFRVLDDNQVAALFKESEFDP